MASKDNSPFVEGNKWRFSEGNQPQRHMTTLQLRKRAEALLCASMEELTKTQEDRGLPVTLRMCAKQIIAGEPYKVAIFINSLDNGRKSKKA